MPFQRALLELAYGQILRRAGQRRAAAHQLQAARDRFAGLKARPYLERCDRELAACGLAPAKRSDFDPSRLTAQESAVARLVALGMGNRQVASELFVSIKTVQFHLTHIYAKLGISTRAELAAQFRDNDTQRRSFSAKLGPSARSVGSREMVRLVRDRIRVSRRPHGALPGSVFREVGAFEQHRDGEPGGQSPEGRADVEDADVGDRHHKGDQSAEREPGTERRDERRLQHAQHRKTAENSNEGCWRGEHQLGEQRGEKPEQTPPADRNRYRQCSDGIAPPTLTTRHWSARSSRYRPPRRMPP